MLFPHAAARSLVHGLRMLEYLARIVGKALYEGILLEYSFSPLFVSKLLGRYSFLDELSSLDVELHRNLVYLKVIILFTFVSSRRFCEHGQATSNSDLCTCSFYIQLSTPVALVKSTQSS